MALEFSQRLVFLAQQLRNAWRLAFPYFCSTSEVTVNLRFFGGWMMTEKWIGRALLYSVVALEGAQVCLSVLLNEWNARFFNAIQDRNLSAFWKELAVFAMIAAAFVGVAAYQLYLSQWLHMRWRRWMTDRYLDLWLDGAVHYRMRLRGEPADNPDQRIAEDIDMFVDRTLSLGIGFISASMMLISFIIILWGLSVHLAIPVGGYAVTVPGLLVWMAIIFAFFGTFGAHRIGWRLADLSFTRQRYEADFRYALVRLRENSEQVALAGGEGRERVLLADRFANVASNWYATMSRQKRLTFFTTGFNQIAVVLPTIVVAPHYFAGLISLGTLTQTGAAFGQVQTALSFFVNAYTRLAQWNSVVDRLIGFETQLSFASDRATRGVGESRNGRIETPLSIQDVDLARPDGTPLAVGARFTVRRGEALLLTGPSGAGKSTLFRAVASIWPFARGVVTLAPGARLVVLSQRPYFPLGSLRAALAYPVAEDGIASQDISAALVRVGLAQLPFGLDEVAIWSEVLSPGQQQRLAICRALLHRPDVLLLDEATAALDEASEMALYQLLRSELSRTAIVSISHRSTLARLHDRSLDCTWLHPPRLGAEMALQ